MGFFGRYPQNDKKKDVQNEKNKILRMTIKKDAQNDKRKNVQNDE